MNDRINRPELPKGWTWTNLSEISDVNLGKTPNKAQYRNHGDYKIIKFRDIIGDKIDWDESDRGFVVNSHDLIVQLRELRERDVLVTASAHSSEHIGKKAVYVSSIPLNYNKVFFVGELLCIRADEEIVNPRIIYYYIISQDGYNSIQSHVRGVHLISSEARQIGIPLSPLPEQYRIAAKIEELFTRLDAGADALNKIKLQLKQYRQAVLKHAFEGKLTEEWREAHKGQMESASVLLERIKEERSRSVKGRNRELPSLDKSDLPALPDGWVWTSLGELAALNPKFMDDIPDELEVSFIPMKCVEELTGQVDLSLTKLYSEVKKGYTAFRNGDVLFAKITPCMENGKVSIVNNLKNGIGFGSTEFHVIRLNSGQMPNRFVFFFLVRESFRRDARMHMTGSAGQLRVPKIYLEEAPIPLPPLAEQHKIVEEIDRCFSVADAIEKDVGQSLKQAERLRQSILKRTFEGKLVPQDPTDEPAEELLKRIRAERAKIEAEKKATGKTRRS